MVNDLEVAVAHVQVLFLKLAGNKSKIKTLPTLCPSEPRLDPTISWI